MQKAEEISGIFVAFEFPFASLFFPRLSIILRLLFNVPKFEQFLILARYFLLKLISIQMLRCRFIVQNRRFLLLEKKDTVLFNQSSRHF